jgi:hypothetical protein
MNSLDYKQFHEEVDTTDIVRNHLAKRNDFLIKMMVPVTNK